VALSDSRWQRTVTLCALYVAQGIPWGFMLITLPAHLADKYDVGVGEIGFLKAIILVPWSFKLIWAPIMDTFTVRSMGRRRPWIIAAEIMMALTLFGMLGLGANLSEQVQTLVWMYFLHNCFASLQDVCTDALAVDILPPEEQGQTNGLMWGSKLVGKGLGAWGLAIVLDRSGLEACVFVQVALLLVILVFPIFFLERKGEKRFPWSRGAARGDETHGIRDLKNTVLETIDESPLPKAQAADLSSLVKFSWPGVLFVMTIVNSMRALALPTLMVYLLFTVVKLIGIGVNEVVTNNLYTQNLGWTDVEFSTVSGAYTLAPILVGTILGGYLADRFGRRLILCLGYGGYAVSALVFAARPDLWTATINLGMPSFLVDLFGTNQVQVRWFAVGYVIAFETSSAVGSVGFLSMAMRISWSRAAATVFTVYMTFSNVSHVIGNGITGWLTGKFTAVAETAGLTGDAAVLYSYELTFWFCGIVTIPPLLLLLWVRPSRVDEAEKNLAIVEGRDGAQPPEAAS